MIHVDATPDAVPFCDWQTLLLAERLSHQLIHLKFHRLDFQSSVCEAISNTLCILDCQVFKLTRLKQKQRFGQLSKIVVKANIKNPKFFKFPPLEFKNRSEMFQNKQ